jgi:hypothetical protein
MIFLKRNFVLLLLSALCSTFYAGVITQAQTTPGANLIKCGGFEGESAYLYWDQESSVESVLLQKVRENEAHSGRCVARLGGMPRTVDTLDQFLGAIPGLREGLTLTFYCRTSGGNKNSKYPDSLSIAFVDANTGDRYGVGVLQPEYDNWALIRLPYSPSTLGMIPGRDYYLRFEASTGRGAQSARFDLDDIALTDSRAMLLPNDPPDPPDTIPDEEGDVPFVNTPGQTAEVTGNVHRDVPNLCSCGYGSHRTITITTGGFTTLSGVAVKFKFSTSTALKAATNISINGNLITCTVPDAPNGKNYLGPAEIKVKVGTNQKAWVSPYSVSNSDGTETGFWYGFPDRIQNVQLLSSASPGIASLGSFSINASGMAVFTKYRPNANPPQCGGGVNRPQDYVNPFIYVYQFNENDPDYVPYLQSKVRVNPSNLTHTCGSANWTSTWTGDGAPTICIDGATPCIPIDGTGAPLALMLLNPDNIQNDTTSDWRQYTYKKGWYTGIVTNAVTFTPPPAPIVSSIGPNAANSVGYGHNISNGTPLDIAIRPLNNATNHVTFQGSNLYRINYIANGDQPNNSWTQQDMVGATWDQPNWGTTFTAWVPAHAPSLAVTPSIATKDMATPIPANASFAYKHSFAAWNSTACLTSPSPAVCDLTYTTPFLGPYDAGYLESFMVGPNEAGAVTATVAWYSGYPVPLMRVGADPHLSFTDGDGISRFVVYHGYAIDSGVPHGSTATYKVTLYLDTVALETRYITVTYQ